MFGFSKKTSLLVQSFVGIIFFFNAVVLVPEVVAQEKVNIEQFLQITEQVKELKKTDLAASLKKLTAFENQLSKLTVEQNLLYFKLLCEIQIQQNKYNSAQKTANKGLMIAKKLSSPSILISELLYLKGFSFESLGDLSQAAIEYKKGLEVAESLHNKVKIAAGLINIGTISYLTDDLERALILLNDAYNIAGQTEDDELKGTANKVLGNVYSHLQQDEQSMAYYQQSHLHFKKVGMLLAAHNSLNNIATTHILNKDYSNAISVLETIIKESNKYTPSDRMFIVYSNMAWANLKKSDSDPETAYQYLLKAKPYLQLTEKSDYQLKYFIAEAYILSASKRFDDALISIKRVEELLKTQFDLSLVKKEDYLDMINLKANVFYQQKKFIHAFDTKSRAILLTEKAYENEDNRSITEVRLKLEAEQADKQSKVLNNQQILYETNLREATLENKQQRSYLIISALVALAFAWVLVRLVQNQQKLKIASSIDALTGAENRRSLIVKSKEAFKNAKIKKAHLSVLMIDVDHFKSINDSLGHSVGDKVLAEIANLSISMMRKSDIFGRYGGEEFMICLPNTGIKSAIIIANRIRLRINDHPWKIANLEEISISVGVASLASDGDISSLIKRADEQLYKAKAEGRNKVCGE